MTDLKNELPAVVKSMIDPLPAVLALHSAKRLEPKRTKLLAAERLEPKRTQLLAESDELNMEEVPKDKELTTTSQDLTEFELEEEDYPIAS